MTDSLFEFDNKGGLVSVCKIAYEEGKDIIDKLKNFDNIILKASTQFVMQVNRDELDIIEQSMTCLGDFIIVIDAVNKDYYKSKSTVILHVSTNSTSGAQKVYDCFMHSVSFELNVSTLQMSLYGVATGTSLAILSSLGAAAPVMFFFAGTGVRPRMPEFVERALSLLMVQTLKANGWLIDTGTKYVLKKPRLAVESPEIPDGQTTETDDVKKI